MILYSAFPSYARLYARYGVPLRQVAWRPYALDERCFVPGPPTTGCEAIISAGYHLRDVDTLLAASRLLSDRVHPIDLYGEDAPVEGHPRIRFKGTVMSNEFIPAAARSRFMVVPLKEDPSKAAGITSFVTGLMLGRPVIATDIGAARDYVRDSVDGLLVPPGDARALAAAIERLDTDAALLAKLEAGAQDARLRLITDHAATELLGGSASYRSDHWLWTKSQRQ